MVKSEGGQRESDGVVVPQGARVMASSGKGTDFDHAGGGGKRLGMAGTARSNHPGGTPPIDNVRKLQRKLWAAAKQSEQRRFHALFDRVHRGDVLWVHGGYTVWALAPAYLLSTRLATVYNLVAGALVIEVYSRWKSLGRYGTSPTSGVQPGRGDRIFRRLGDAGRLAARRGPATVARARNARRPATGYGRPSDR